MGENALQLGVLCVCMVCVCMVSVHMRVLCVHVHVGIEARGQHQVSFTITLNLILLRQGHVLNLELTNLAAWPRSLSVSHTGVIGSSFALILETELPSPCMHSKHFANSPARRFLLLDILKYQ